MKRHVHIDSDINILVDEAAKEALTKENDSRFLSEDSGIIRVPTARWLKAQVAERKHWMVRSIGASNDRNDEHFWGFDGYGALRGLTFRSALELGCGPFTNMRLIANACQVQECSLLDPLIESYLSHPNCAYTRQYIFLDDIPSSSPHIATKIMRRLPLAGRITKRLSRMVRPRRRVPIRRILATPIESMPEDSRYDLIAIMNVIEHCYDVESVFDKVLSIMEEEAVIVFCDKYYDHNTVAETVKMNYDAAHPLRVDGRIVDAFLEANFNLLYKTVKESQFTFLSEDIKWQELYYIGAKR